MSSEDFLAQHPCVDVAGTDLLTYQQVEAALGIEGSCTFCYQSSEGVRMQLPWPFWFKGVLVKGEIVVGDTKYTAPCENFAIPAIQDFCILQPITIRGRLRTAYVGGIKQ